MAGSLIDGGVDILQIRAKNLDDASVVLYGRPVAELCKPKQIPLIINDKPALVKMIGADGCHVGQDDMSVRDARSLMGLPGGIVGKSTHSLSQARESLAEEPDYIGFGPLFATPTKPDYAPIGTADIRAAHEMVPFPIFCIGGIKPENLPPVIDSGAKRVVIVSGLLCADDPCQTARVCRGYLHSRVK